MDSPDSPPTPRTPESLPTPFSLVDSATSDRAQSPFRPHVTFDGDALDDFMLDAPQESNPPVDDNIQTRLQHMMKSDPFFHFDPTVTYYGHPDVPEISEQKRRKLFDSYFKSYSFMRHHLESFNFLMDNVFPQIIEENNHMEIVSKKHNMKHVVRMVNMSICKPMFKENDGLVHDIRANDGSARKFTYSSTILIDLIHEVYERQVVSIVEKGKGESDGKGDGKSEEKKITPPSTQLPQTPQPTYTEESVGENGPVIITYRDVLKEHRVYKEFTLFHMPIMVGSKYCHSYEQVRDVTCPYIPSGYFIVNGNEKVIIPREKLRTNHPYITVDSSGNIKCEVRSWHENKMRSTSTLFAHLTFLRGGNIPQIAVNVPFIKKGNTLVNIAVAHIFRILGIHDPNEMRRYILLKEGDTTRDHPYDQYIRSILKDDRLDLSKEDLMDYIGKQGTNEVTREKKIRTIENIFHNEFLPHMGLEKTPEMLLNKAVYFGYIILRMLRVYRGDESADDRDDYSNKRLETVHMLCALQFRQLLRNFKKTFTTSIHKAIENEKFIYVIDMMKNAKRITAGFKFALSTGKWGMSKGASTQTGVAQILTRMNVLSTLSHLRRINTPINRDGKMTQPRQLHPSSWGITCCSESTEGNTCGLIKNMALMCHIRLGYPSILIDRVVAPHIVRLDRGDVKSDPFTPNRSKSWVFINGRFVGVVKGSDEEFVKLMRSYRRNQSIPFDTSIAHRKDLNEIQIYVDAGCCCRPVFVLENLHKFESVYETYSSNSEMLWDMMVTHGIIEYIDKCEEFTVRVAVSWSDLKVPRRANEMEYTHIEIHPIVIMGIAVATLPFCNHDQAPRVTYGSVMSKQGLGVVGLNYSTRYDTGGSHLLWYPQRPLVTTFMNRIAGFDHIPYTINAIAAIATYTGYNQEDSVIMNQSSVDRGLFRSFFFRTHKDTAKNVGADQEVFERPDRKVVTGMKRGIYDKITLEDATMDLNCEVSQDDAIVGKVMRTIDQNKRSDDDKVQKDKSLLYRSKENARIDSVTRTISKDGAIMINVRTRAMRVPRIGDKFASKKGQKGICSLLLRHEDMPFSAQGIVPDLIINPNAIPSRMTCSQIMESVLGKTAALAGQVGDGSAWNGITDEDISNELQRHGFERYGNEMLRNGMTGELMECPIFIGPVPYMRLKHMVIDKIHARRTGPRQFLTRQPLEGRAREGGLRFGEMERDMLISHGAAAVLQDRLLFNSDYYETVVCTRCQVMAQLPPAQNQHYRELLGEQKKAYCSLCESSDSIERVAMPCAFKVLMQNLEACHVRMKMTLTDVNENDNYDETYNGDDVESDYGDDNDDDAMEVE